LLGEQLARPQRHSGPRWGLISCSVWAGQSASAAGAPTAVAQRP